MQKGVVMKSTFENHCLFVLASCLVAALGLLALNQQCSLSAITLAVAGVGGIVSGMPGVIATFGQRWAEKYGKANAPLAAPI